MTEARLMKCFFTSVVILGNDGRASQFSLADSPFEKAFYKNLIFIFALFLFIEYIVQIRIEDA